MRPPAFTLLCVFALIPACGRDVPEGDPNFTPDPSFLASFPDPWLQNPHRYQSTLGNGVIRAHNSGAPKFAQQVRLELDLAIGRDSGPEEYILFTPANISVDGRGRILVFDARRRSILVYGPDGGYVRSIGRRGSGPGEFATASPRFQLWRDGTLDAVVNDGRWQRWDVSGELLFDRHPLDISSSPSTHRYPASTGDFSIIFDSPWYGYARRDTSSGWWVYRKDTSSDAHQVVTRLRRGGTDYITGQFEGDNLGARAPYSQELMIRQSPTGGFILSYGDSSSFSQYDETLTKRMVVIWDQAPERLTKDEVVDAFKIYNPAPEWGKDQLLRWVKSYNWHETKPVIADILIGVDGRIWIQLWDDDPWAILPRPVWERRGSRYLVFTPSGELEMALALPFRLSAASETHLYELLNDGESTPQVRRYRWRRDDIDSPD